MPAASSRSPAHGHSGAGTLSGLGKLLKAHGSPGGMGTALAQSVSAAAAAEHAETNPVDTCALIRSLCTYATEGHSSAGSTQPHATPSHCVTVSCTAGGLLRSGDTGLGAVGAAATAATAGGADVAELQVALCLEVQLLAECGLSALRYIPKLTALSSLMQGSW